MFKRVLLITIILTIALTASVIGLLPDNTQAVDNNGDTIFAARLHTIDIAIVADPQCPTGSSGTGGGC